jgi:hypothetical protein
MKQTWFASATCRNWTRSNSHSSATSAKSMTILLKATNKGNQLHANRKKNNQCCNVMVRVRHHSTTRSWKKGMELLLSFGVKLRNRGREREEEKKEGQ